LLLVPSLEVGGWFGAGLAHIEARVGTIIALVSCDDNGVQRVMPGRITSVDGGIVRYDTASGPGTAGAPVVELRGYPGGGFGGAVYAIHTGRDSSGTGFGGGPSRAFPEHIHKRVDGRHHQRPAVDRGVLRPFQQRFVAALPLLIDGTRRITLVNGEPR